MNYCKFIFIIYTYESYCVNRLVQINYKYKKEAGALEEESKANAAVGERLLNLSVALAAHGMYVFKRGFNYRRKKENFPFISFGTNVSRECQAKQTDQIRGSTVPSFHASGFRSTSMCRCVHLK